MYNNFYSQENQQPYYQNVPFEDNSFQRGIEIERLIFEFQENRRRINNLLKRINRLENYLRIKDDEDF